ncbi:hypothetical protein N9L01_00390 [bacterium]|jgi:hypothetical protein|nr:hypothetical protein [bacterium]
MVAPVDEKDHIDQEFDQAADARTEAKRQAWRSLLIPAVGSAAFFGSTVANAIKTYRRVGWPGDAFNATDWMLISLPFIMVVIAVGQGTNGHSNHSVDS